MITNSKYGQCYVCNKVEYEKMLNYAKMKFINEIARMKEFDLINLKAVNLGKIDTNKCLFKHFHRRISNEQ